MEVGSGSERGARWRRVGGPEQTRKVAVLAAAGSGPEHVAKLTIHLDPGVDPDEAYAASAAVWPYRTAVTVLAVAPARPGALVEVEAVASIPSVGA